MTLPNGDLVVTFQQSSPPYGILERYNSAGALQLSYTQYGSNPTTNNVAPNILADYTIDPDTFWANQYDDDTSGDQVRFVQYDVATGAIIRQFLAADGRSGLPFAIVRKSW
jgi:hypothetical protein